ncbi:hypothetical protein BJX61DRAFT_493685 [Aspergillus egyptiacus]|nr:hypothetical protein BJX61DRAFT_493685 [Aspergillus egyptiacus]
MTTRKRNEFLDIVPSDDDDNDRGYDSEAAEESKSRVAKRRKTQSRPDGSESGSDEEQSDASDIEETDAEAEDIQASKRKQKSKSRNGTQEESNDGEGSDEDKTTTNEYGDQFLDVTAEKEGKKDKNNKKLNKLKVKPGKKNKTGVVYFSSLPPYLKPFALKSMLETRGFAPITKVFLTPAVPASSAPRRRSNKRKTYTDGWVEFASKKTAKICAETLNATIVGGRKGGWYHDDVWNMKYLRGYKWSDLQESIARERSEAAAKRRIEDMRARKEEKVFLQGYEKGKMLEGIQKKNEEKRKRKMQEAAGTEDGEREGSIKARRLFKQNEVKLGRDKIMDEAGLEEDTRRVLTKIF